MLAEICDSVQSVLAGSLSLACRKVLTISYVKTPHCVACQVNILPLVAESLTFVVFFGALLACFSVLLAS